MPYVTVETTTCLRHGNKRACKSAGKMGPVGGGCLGKTFSTDDVVSDEHESREDAALEMKENTVLHRKNGALKCS